MEFFGLTIPPNGKAAFTVPEGSVLNVSNATLLLGPKKGKEPGTGQHSVKCTVGSTTSVVCALREKFAENAPLALSLAAGKITFKGSPCYSISLTGHLIPIQTTEFEMEDDTAAANDVSADEVEEEENPTSNGMEAYDDDDDDDDDEEEDEDDDDDEEEDEEEEEEKPQPKSNKRKAAEPVSEQPPTKKKVRIVKMPNGLKYRDIKEGSGRKAKKGNTLSVRYRGLLKNGIEFDSNMPKGRPFSFRLGAGEVVAGWDQGLVGLAVGGRRELVIPPKLGYGQSGVGSTIPPNATLLFEVQLLKIK